MAASVHVGLVHWPVLDRSGQTIVTNVTNFDIHDIARACRAYGVTKYHIINRSREQLMFVSRVLEHWRVGAGVDFNPMRRSALENIELAETVQDAVRRIAGRVRVMATSAQAREEIPEVSFAELRSEIEAKNPDESIFLLFGTGCGLESSVYQLCEGRLPPIQGASPDDYRHLSVRSAVSICLDRLLSR